MRCGKSATLYFPDSTRAVAGSGKATGLGLPSPGKSPVIKKNLDVVDRVANGFAALAQVDVATADPFLLAAFEILAPDADIDILSGTLEAGVAEID